MNEIYSQPELGPRDIQALVMEQYSKVKINPEDLNNEGKLLAFPNGPISHLSELEWKMTRTPAFKEWFGESVVIDENNEPLVMYHGSKHPERFDQFITEYDVAEQAGRSSPGFELVSFITKGTHFTDNPTYIEALLGQGKVMYRTFLSIAHPFESDENITTDQLSKEAVEEMQRQGIDGIKTPESGGCTYVAFEPTQILIIPSKDTA